MSSGQFNKLIFKTMKNQVFKITVAALLLLLINSCGTTCKMSMKKHLASNPWEMSTLKGSAPDAKEFQTGIPFLLFDKKGKMTGSTGCNNMAGNYQLNKSGIVLEPGAITRMACQGKGETLFLEALKQVKNFKVDGEKLVLLNGADEIMTLVPKK
jgi:heat shock protein HslJ